MNEVVSRQQWSSALAEGTICRAFDTHKEDGLLLLLFYSWDLFKNENLFLWICSLILGSLQILFFFSIKDFFPPLFGLQ